MESDTRSSILGPPIIYDYEVTELKQLFSVSRHQKFTG